jgi:peptide/nickel transport system substrate-binding protein
VIPLFTQPDWGEFDTARFTGFPSASNPYATGQTRYPGAVIVLTTIKPVSS